MRHVSSPEGWDRDPIVEKSPAPLDEMRFFTVYREE
jgi:hypothetical protein